MLLLQGPQVYVCASATTPALVRVIITLIGNIANNRFVYMKNDM